MPPHLALLTPLLVFSIPSWPAAFAVRSEAVQVGPTRHEVTAILVLYGLPRLLTGCILAHECTHAYL